MKKSLNVVIIIIIFILIIAIILTLLKSNEDSWIKDSRGVWIKHGNVSDSNIPSQVEEQQEVINKSLDLYYLKKSQGMSFSSQCLGTITPKEGIYAVDIVHVPRNVEDDLPTNQCTAYRNGMANHFIELDKYGNLVRIL